jgi:hypothetical protein
MSNITFKLQSSKSPAEIYIRFRRGRGIDHLVKIGKKIDVKDWDKAKARPKHTRNEELSTISSFIAEIQKRILDNIEQDILDGKNIDLNWLKKQINPNLNLKIPNKIVDYFDYYLLQKRNSIKESTIKKIRTSKNLFINFEKWAKKSYQINEIDLEFQYKLDEFANDDNFNYSPNYIADLIKLTKTLCKNARLNGLRTNPQTELLKAIRVKIPFIYLNENDILKIKNHPFISDYLDNARDWLLISCDSGQRVSDFMRFKKNMVVEDTTKKGNKVKYISFVQKKTSKTMSVLVTEMIEEILDKRNGDFPRGLSSQKYNIYIKKICEIVGLNEIVSGSMKDSKTKRQVFGKFKKYELVASHVGRRSFASNYFNKYPVSYLMNQTGHTTERAFLDYIGKTNVDLTHDFADEIIRKR